MVHYKTNDMGHDHVTWVYTSVGATARRLLAEYRDQHTVADLAHAWVASHVERMAVMSHSFCDWAVLADVYMTRKAMLEAGDMK